MKDEVIALNTAEPIHQPLNYYGARQYRDACKRVCSAVYSILAEHCGPVARYAAWPSANTMGETTDTEFSKDGISIVERLHYPDASIERQILEMIVYVGRRVNNACFDGSTTAIMVATGIIEEYFATENPQIIVPTRPVPAPHHVAHGLDGLFKVMEAALDASKLTVADYEREFNLSPSDARRSVAYAQAMISSKGDRELSEALAELVAKTPVEELFGQYSLDHHVHESDRRVEVKTYDAHIGFPAGLCDPNLNNKDLGTEYMGEDADLIVTENLVIPPNPFYDFLSDQARQWTIYLKLCISGKAPDYASDDALEDPRHAIFDRRESGDLIIIAPEFDSRLKASVYDLNLHYKRLKYKGRLVLVELTARNSDLRSAVSSGGSRACWRRSYARILRVGG